VHEKKQLLVKSAELGRCSTRHIYRPTRLCECLQFKKSKLANNSLAWFR